MDKYALVQYHEGNTYPNPFLISGWEIPQLPQPSWARVGGVTVTDGPLQPS